MTCYDVMIIGGGPIGANIAHKLASNGCRCAILEEHTIIGEPLQCAGLVSNRVFDYIPFEKTTVIQNTITGADIHAPDGTVLSIGGTKNHAFVIDRKMFDSTMIEKAIESGAQFHLQSRVKNIKKHEKSIHLEIKQKNMINTMKCSLLIGADGPYSITRRLFSFPQPKEFLHGIGAEIIGINLDPHTVHILVGHAIAPGFFAWIIPLNETGTQARIGLCTVRDASTSIQSCFTQLLKNKLICNGKIIKRTGGTIHLGILSQTAASNVLLVGDAAAQVKPTSGGGIYPGLVGAKWCSQVAQQAITDNTFEFSFLKKYHTLWTQDIGKELKQGMLFRQIYRTLRDKDFNKLISKFNEEKIISIINQYGDIDYPSKLLFPLLLHVPSLLKMVPKILNPY